MRNVPMNRDVDRAAFSDNALDWFREGDELAHASYHQHIQYINESGGLRSKLGRATLILGSLAAAVLALSILMS